MFRPLQVLNGGIEQYPVETGVNETDALIVVFNEAIHGGSPLFMVVVNDVDHHEGEIQLYVKS